MGMLMDFYVGDVARIGKAWRLQDDQALADPEVVSAHVDLSFHLDAEALDALVAAACDLEGRPAMTFESCVVGDADPQAESGLHEMSDAFRDLLADLGPAHSAQLVDRWVARWPRQSPALAPHRPAPRQAIRDGLQRAVVGAVLAPIFGVLWLASRGFREERRQNRARLPTAAKSPPATAPEAATAGDELLREAVGALVEACRSARARGQRVLYAWSL